MVIYEGAQEILAVADSGRAAPVRVLDRVDARIGGRAVHLYLVLVGHGVLLASSVVGRYNDRGHSHCYGKIPISLV